MFVLISSFYSTKVTYFQLQSELYLGPAGLPVQLWGHHYLQKGKMTLGFQYTCSCMDRKTSQWLILPGTDVGGAFSSIISNLSCLLFGVSPLLHSLTPTHSWGNSSVASTRSSKIGRESGSRTDMCWKRRRRTKIAKIELVRLHDLKLWYKLD